jgi:hypothetical protein
MFRPVWSLHSSFLEPPFILFGASIHSFWSRHPSRLEPPSVLFGAAKPFADQGQQRKNHPLLRRNPPVYDHKPPPFNPQKTVSNRPFTLQRSLSVCYVYCEESMPTPLFQSLPEYTALMSTGRKNFKAVVTLLVRR